MKLSTVNLTVTLLLSALLAGAAGQKTIRAVLQRPAERKMAPAFRLLSASGEATGPSSYRGKVVLLDFWATECGGCRAEIPDFIELRPHTNRRASRS